MKHIKKVTIAVAALALIGALSASAASAKTVICEEAVTTCPAGKIMPAGTSIGGVVNTKDAPETKLTLTMGITGFTCEIGMISAKSSAEAGNPLLGTGESSPLGCNKEACEITFKSGAPVTMVATGGGNGTITFGSSEKHQSVTINCGLCSSTYGAASVPFQFKPTEYAMTATNVTLNWESGVKCGSKPATLNATLFSSGKYLSSI